MTDFDPYARILKLEADLRRLSADRDIWKQTATSFEKSAKTLEQQRDKARATVEKLQDALNEAADALEGTDYLRSDSIAERIVKLRAQLEKPKIGYYGDPDD